MLGLIFSSKLDWGSYILSIAKTASKKIQQNDSAKQEYIQQINNFKVLFTSFIL